MFRIQFIILVVCVLVSNMSHDGFSQLATQQNGPPDFSTTIKQAQTLIQQQKFIEAEAILKPATEKFADKMAPWYLLAYALHNQKKYDEALPLYQKANSFPQGKINTNYNIACIYAIQNKRDEAFDSLKVAIKAGFNNFAHMQNDPEMANLKNDPRFQELTSKKPSADQLFVEPTRIIHQWNGEAAGDQFGWTGRKVGDIDGDGTIDIIATAPTFGQNAGKVYVYSSSTGKLLHSVTGKPGQQLGNSAVGIGDVNGDKIPDFAAGAPAPRGTGSVNVYSGRDASLIHSVKGTTTGTQFGYEVSEFGDVDNDGTPDYFVGELNGNGAVKKCGRAIVYSGRTAKPIFELTGERTGDAFGNAAAGAKIADGEFLLAIGAKNAGAGNRGQVYVFHVKDSKPSLRFKIKGNKNSVNLGQMFIAFPGDLDRDGVPDVYASDFSDRTKAPGGGKVVVHSGATGKELLALYGKQPGEGLGTSPSDAGDVDGDGIGDLVIGAWQNREGAQSGGKVYLYSCAGTVKLLRSWTCKQAGDTLGFDATGIGDVDGDGHIDFLLTSAWSNVSGAKSGRVFIVAGEKH